MVRREKGYLGSVGREREREKEGEREMVHVSSSGLTDGLSEVRARRCRGRPCSSYFSPWSGETECVTDLTAIQVTGGVGIRTRHSPIDDVAARKVSLPRTYRDTGM